MLLEEFEDECDRRQEDFATVSTATASSHDRACEIESLGMHTGKQLMVIKVLLLAVALRKTKAQGACWVFGRENDGPRYINAALRGGDDRKERQI